MKTRKATMQDCQICNEPPHCGTKPEPCNISEPERGKGIMVYCSPGGRDQDCVHLYLIHPAFKPLCRRNIVGEGSALSPVHGTAEDKNKNNDCLDYMARAELKTY